MWNSKYATGFTLLLTCVLLLDKGECQSSLLDPFNTGGQTQQGGQSGGSGTAAGGGGGMPNWMQMADQFMSSWMSSVAARRNTANNGTARSGGFFEGLMDGIANFSNEMAARVQNSTSTIPPRVQRMQNRTRNWFNNWRSNMFGFF